MLDVLCVHMQDLASKMPHVAAAEALKLLQAAGEAFSAAVARATTAAHGAAASCWPGADTLMYLQLFAVLFPVSDFRHVVLTPAAVFMARVLAQGSVRSRKDVVSGLFMCSLVERSSRESRRVHPESLAFMGALLEACAQEAVAEEAGTRTKRRRRQRRRARGRGRRASGRS